MNRTIMECERSLRLHAGFPLQFWVDAVDTVVYLINIETSSSLDGRIPEEAWTSKKVNYSFIRTFGCEEFVHIDKDYNKKLAVKSKKCTFIDDATGKTWVYCIKKNLMFLILLRNGKLWLRMRQERN